MTVTPKSLPLKSTALQRGLSLVELVAVLAIIGVLTSISVPMYSEYIIRSKILTAQEIIQDKVIALTNYYSDHGTYIGNFSDGGCSATVNTVSGYNTSDWSVYCKPASSSTYVLEVGGLTSPLKLSTTTAVSMSVDQSGSRTFKNGYLIDWNLRGAGGSDTANCWPINKIKSSCTGT